MRKVSLPALHNDPAQAELYLYQHERWSMLDSERKGPQQGCGRMEDLERREQQKEGSREAAHERERSRKVHEMHVRRFHELVWQSRAWGFECVLISTRRAERGSGRGTHRGTRRCGSCSRAR